MELIKGLGNKAGWRGTPQRSAEIKQAVGGGAHQRLGNKADSRGWSSSKAWGTKQAGGSRTNQRSTEIKQAVEGVELIKGLRR
jgi:hypothetical protein